MQIDGTLLTPAGWREGELAFGAAIESVRPGKSVGGRFVIPGFIDTHVHGGDGAECMEGEAATRHMARFHARHGTTTLLPTTWTAPRTEIVHAVTGIGAVARRAEKGEPSVPGFHLEGPFINPAKLGAQPPFAIPPDIGFAADLAALAPMKVVTMAPEIDGDFALLRWFVAHGVRVHLGHSLASYDLALRAFAAGATGATHLFNAMSGLHHREPGLAGASLALAGHAEMILDLEHVAAGAVRVARRAIPGLYGITDAVAAAGVPAGQFRLGGHDVISDGVTVRMADGTLAGSMLTMDQALRNLMALDVPLAEASARLATIPAAYLGLHDRGTLEVGRRADLVVVDGMGHLEAVYVGGAAIARV